MIICLKSQISFPPPLFLRALAVKMEKLLEELYVHSFKLPMVCRLFSSPFYCYHKIPDIGYSERKEVIWLQALEAESPRVDIAVCVASIEGPLGCLTQGGEVKAGVATHRTDQAHVGPCSVTSHIPETSPGSLEDSIHPFQRHHPP